MPDELPRGDKAIYVFLEMIALAFVFAAVERLFDGKPWQVATALVAALVFFIAGIIWSQAKVWIGLHWAVGSMGLLTLIILVAIGYDIYDRHRHVAVPPIPSTLQSRSQAPQSPPVVTRPAYVPPVQVSAPWQLSKTQETKLLGLLSRPCETISDLKLYMKNLNPNVVVVLQDPHDPDEYRLGTKIVKLMRAAGCSNVNIEPFRVEEFVQNFEPFFGIEVWDGYNGKTREAANLLQGALVKVRPDTSIISGGKEPQGGHFEGIAVMIGKLTH